MPRTKLTCTDKQRKGLCLLIGPESTGTRFFETVFSSHPLILGTPDAMGHTDILDEVWHNLEKGDKKRAAAVFPTLGEHRYILTRRSIPHADILAESAVFMKFPNLEALYQLTQRLDLDLTLLITSRSPVPHIASWTQRRLSVDASFEKAKAQYQAAFRHLFNFICRTDVIFYILSLEGLLLDRQEYVQSIFQILGLPSHPIALDLQEDTNRKHYGWYR